MNDLNKNRPSSAVQVRIRKLLDSGRSVLTSMLVLRAMQKAGHICFAPDTGKKVRHWSGATVTAVYVDGPPDGKPNQFEFGGIEWELRYIDGCFYPFVCLAGSKSPSFV
jgi:hypothetical protein